MNPPLDIWIYVVDDEPEIGEVLLAFFELEGYPTAVFTDPNVALQSFQNAHPRPRLLVTDYVMSPINGMELLEQCRRAEPPLSSIVISGNVGEDEMLLYPFHPNHFVRKPFQSDKLLKLVHGLIGPGVGHPI